MSGLALDPTAILFGSERVTTNAAQLAGAADAREVFLQQLLDLAGAMPPPQTGEEWAGVLQQTFQAATVYVRQAGAFPMDDPNNVHRLLENGDLDSDLEDFSFLEGMAIPIQKCCYEVKIAEERIWTQDCAPDSAVARLRSSLLRYLLDSTLCGEILQTVEEYLEAVDHQIKAGAQTSR